MAKALPPTFPWSVTDEEAPTRRQAVRSTASGVSNITTEALLDKIRAAGLLAVAVEAVLDRDNDMTFSGELDAYLNAIKSLHIDTVFFSATTLDDEDFLSELDLDDDGAQFASHELTMILPSIGKYRSNIGKVGQLDIAAYTNVFGLTLSLVTDWYDEFVTERERALSILSDEADSANARREAEREMRLQDGLQKLETLSGDRAFMSLPTQRAMRAYALEHIPELANLDDHALRTAIADLKARFQARSPIRK